MRYIIRILFEIFKCTECSAIERNFRIKCWRRSKIASNKNSFSFGVDNRDLIRKHSETRKRSVLNSNVCSKESLKS